MREERKRLKLSQAVLAQAAGIARESWVRYEADAMAPGSAVLAALAAKGADVSYVLTGVRAPVYAGGPIRGDSVALVLTAEESALVDNYRHASAEGRRALAATSAAVAQPVETLKSTGSGGA